MFSAAPPDVRWMGNERGTAGITNWSTVDPRIMMAPGVSGDEVMRSLQEGGRDGTVCCQVETDDGRGWQPLCASTTIGHHRPPSATIGHRRLERVSASAVRRLRVMLDETLEPPLPLRIRCHAPV